MSEVAVNSDKGVTYGQAGTGTAGDEAQMD